MRKKKELALFVVFILAGLVSEAHASGPSKRHVQNDYDGDGKTDMATWRPSNGEWFIAYSSNAQNVPIGNFGASADIPVPGDYDGDGKTDLAVWRPSNGEWFINYSSTGQKGPVNRFGVSGDIPTPGDYDGDGKTDMAVWRPSTGEWFIAYSSNASQGPVANFGTRGDIPVPGDYDGDGKTDLAVWRPSTGEWYITYSSTGWQGPVTQWGTQGDIPVPGDYDGDGATDMAVWRPSTGEWFITYSSTRQQVPVAQWGMPGDIPVPGDYDGDGKTDLAVWRPSTGEWYIIYSSTGQRVAANNWGILGDIPQGTLQGVTSYNSAFMNQPSSPPAGFFFLNGTGYYSSGSGSVCDFSSWNSYRSYEGNSNAAVYPSYTNTKLPAGLTNTGICKTSMPAGYIILADGTSLYSNGAGHACVFSSLASFIASGGNPNLTIYPLLNAFPSALVNDGPCKTSGSYPINGYIDGVFTQNDGTYAIQGWACGVGSSGSISVDVNFNGVYGTGATAEIYPANSSSEPALATSCRSTGKNYRFIVPINSYLTSNSSQTIDMYGLAPMSAHYPNSNSTLLANSGAYTVPPQTTSGLNPVKMVDCSVEGNCRNDNAYNVSPSPPSSTNGVYDYAYGPSIIKMNGQYHAFYCSTGRSGDGSGNGWDAIRYTTSSDGFHWSPGVVMLTATGYQGTSDLSACDPSVVYFNGYYYLYYGAAYVSPGNNTLTDIQVARSASISGPYLTLTTGGTWEQSPTNPQIIIKPLKDVPGYGAGQPTVVNYNGKVRMWYTDTTYDPTYGGNHIFMLDSSDGIKWTPTGSAEISMPGADVDVKYNAATRKFVMYAITSASDGNSELATSQSSDGMHWPSWTPANVISPVNIYHMESIGVSGDQYGNALQVDATLISFGAPILLQQTTNQTESHAQWSLYGIFTLGGRI